MTTKVTNELVDDGFVLKPVYDSGIITVATQIIDITGLNLEPTGVYRMVYTLENENAASASYYLYPNGHYTVTEYSYQLLNASSATVGAARANSNKIARASATSNVTGHGVIDLDGKSYFSAYLNNSRGRSITAYLEIFSTVRTSALAGNLTSLRFESSHAGGIGVDSRIRIYRDI